MLLHLSQEAERFSPSLFFLLQEITFMVQLKDLQKLLLKWHLVKTWVSKSGCSHGWWYIACSAAASGSSAENLCMTEEFQFSGGGSLKANKN